jgi:hypothetical protein
MSVLRSLRAAIAASVCLVTVSGSVWATPDPLMQWGPHPSYDSRYYSGVWSKVKNSNGVYTNSDYSLLVSAADTYINTPASQGTLFLRTDNTDRMALSDSWIVMYRALSLYSTTAAKQGSSTWTTLSDGRTKQNVSTFRAGLDALKQVRPVTYTYNGLAGSLNDGKEFVGVIAQDVEQVAPFMVTSMPKKLRPTDEKETNIKQLDANAFTYMLINAVQELSEQNEQLKRIVCKDHPNDAYCVKGAGTLAKR